MLTRALEAGVPYVALVACPRRGAAVLASLDVSDEQRARVHTPAGLDIDARSPAEIAISVLAQVVALRGERRVPAEAADRPAGARRRSDLRDGGGGQRGERPPRP